MIVHKNEMKKLFYLFLSVIFLVSCGVFNTAGNTDPAQPKTEVITFMGIPIDGSKRVFVQELRKKGFKYDNSGKLLEGQFNGKKVKVVVTTNKNKVDRVYVMFPSNRASIIKSEYNILLDQLTRNDKYMRLVDTPIPDEEDIAYEISSNGKRYYAAFYAKPSNFADIKDDLLRTFLGLKISQEDLGMSSEERTAKWYSDNMLGTVWFTIFPYSSSSDEYYIGLFYDNEKNRPHGEDL